MESNKAKCRLCDSKASAGIKVFSKRGRNLNIPQIILLHFAIQFNKDDGLSNLICQKCWRTTKHFHELYCNVKNNLKIVKCPPPCNEELADTIMLKNEIKNEELDLEAKLLTVIENLESISKTEGHVADDEVIDEDHIANVSAELVAKENNSCPSPLKQEVITKPSVKQKIKTNKTDTIGDDTKIANRLKFAEQNKQISDFIGMQCDICLLTLKTFTELKKHYKSDHGIVGYLRCCKRKYFRQNKLYLHIQNHRFPNQYKCDGCDKSFLDTDCLRKHKRTHDQSRKKLPCPHCTKQFEYRSLLDHHIGTHEEGHMGKPCICDICNKSFNTRTAIAAHLFNMHTDKGTHICDACARVFRSRSQLDQHYKINHMGIVEPKVQCKVCGAWQSNKYYLSRHMRRHITNEQTCTVCGKTFANRECLNNHRRRSHGKKSHQCPMCDKAFVTKKAKREHMSTHTGYSLYKCPYCTMEFKSGANMYKHRKRAHPIEWENDRGKHINTRLNTPNYNSKLN